MKLSELERLAREALAWSETIGEYEWYSPRELHTIGKAAASGMSCVSESDSAFIAAANPQTILRMIEVIKAAKRYQVAWEEPRSGASATEDRLDAWTSLRSALKEMEK